jgi:hypothetical protein
MQENKLREVSAGMLVQLPLLVRLYLQSNPHETTAGASSPAGPCVLKISPRVSSGMVGMGIARPVQPLSKRAPGPISNSCTKLADGVTFNHYWRGSPRRRFEMISKCDSLRNGISAREAAYSFDS